MVQRPFLQHRARAWGWAGAAERGRQLLLSLSSCRTGGGTGRGEETKVPGRKFGAVADVEQNTNEEASELQPHLSYYVMAYFSALHLFGDCSQAGSSPAATKSKSTEINLALTD